MAESSGENDDEKQQFHNNQNFFNLDGTDEENNQSNPKPDIGLGLDNNSVSGRKLDVTDNSSVAGSSSRNDPSSVPRREENPFSFKHFLNRDNNSLPVGGARPKMFSCSTTVPNTSPSRNKPAPRLVSNPELTSGLPDFVQDHLVIEQCYLLNNSHSPGHLAVDLDNLPDFAPVSNNNDHHQWNSGRHQPGDIPFDLTSSENRSRDIITDSSPILPLDLPESLPFDLPSAPSEVGPSKSLPDFLSDGPILSERRNDNSQPNSEVNSPSASNGELHRHSPRIHMENERLRRELDATRRQLIDQVRRNEMLEAELVSLRSREYPDEAGIEKVIEQFEDSLKRSTRRAVVAESHVSKLKDEIRKLSNELHMLRSQGASCSNWNGTNSQRLACELRAAAGSAEISLRQLLNGVDNLRLIASTLENRNVEEEESLSDFDSDTMNNPGPAL